MLAADEQIVRRVILSTDWPHWVLGVAAVALVAAIVWLYGIERRLVARRWGMLMTGLRALLALVIVAILAQPVIRSIQHETLKRWVVLLVDDSLSTDVVDLNRTPGQQLRLADALGRLDADARPLRLDWTAAALRAAAQGLAPAAGWFEQLGRSRRLQLPTEDLADRRDDAAGPLRTFEEDLKRLSDSIQTPGAARLTGGLAAEVADLRNRIDGQLAGTVASLLKQLETLNTPVAIRDMPAAQVEQLVRRFDRLDRWTEEVAVGLETLGRRCDEQLAKTADARAREAMKTAAALTRRQVAAALLGLGDRDDRVLGFETDQTPVACYLFAGTARQREVGEAREELAAATPTTRPADAAKADHPGDRRDLTDLAGAITTALSEMTSAGRRIACFVVISDAQHNAAGDPLKAARAVATAGVPLWPVALGAPEPPMDAAIVDVDAPTVVYQKDQVDFDIAVKLDGLAGRPVAVQLIGPDNKIEDRQTLQASGATQRVAVTLSHEPDTLGQKLYRVRVGLADGASQIARPVAGEVFDANNERTVGIRVSNQRRKVLIVEGPPRWEYRYLRNMFNRDPSIELQYVLLRRPAIQGLPATPPITAKADRKDPGQADRLPEDIKDLVGFDVIVLGDVDPKELQLAGQEMLETYVADRGGTLILIAGPHHMPKAYAEAPLGKLLPVRDTPPGKPRGFDEPIHERYRLGLAAAGRSSVVCRLAAVDDRNEELWDSLPPAHWRSNFRFAKGAAEVLLFARPDAPPPPDQPVLTPAGRPDKDRRAEDEALLAVQNYGRGRVMFFGWDETWRMRYKHGDQHHHKFWGQVMRWAAGDQLPAGLKLIKLGTDKPLYAKGDAVIVRAKLTSPEGGPVTDGQLSARITRGSAVASEATMSFQPGSAGVYTASVPDLPPGTYQATLRGPSVTSLRQPDDPTGDVAIEFVVAEPVTPERIELAVNRPLLAELARTGGTLPLDAATASMAARQTATDPVTLSIQKQWALWHSWPLLLVFVSIVTLEWVFRKWAGLM